MSLETWKDEFYHTPAVANNESDEMALKHCLRKWEGTTQENLEKHKVEWELRSVVDNESNLTFEDRTFYFDESNCALCHRHSIGRPRDLKCKECPLSEIGEACDDENSAWYRGPEAMVVALRKALTMVEEKYLEEAKALPAQDPVVTELDVTLDDLYAYGSKNKLVLFDALGSYDSLESLCVAEMLSGPSGFLPKPLPRPLPKECCKDGDIYVYGNLAVQVKLDESYKDLDSTILKYASDKHVAVLCRGTHLAEAIGLLKDNKAEEAKEHLRARVAYVYGGE